MDRYDVGVLGLWPGCNYGSIATYYALNKVLESMGKSVLMIDKPILSDKDAERTMTHSRRFANEHYNISEQYRLNELYKLNEQCDAFVIGSDQVWNYGISKNFGKTFYFDFVEEKKKKIAYAVSFGHGIDFATPEEREKISKYMEKIDGISVREDEGVKICKEDYNINATHVLDPVFLADSSIYTPLIKKSKVDEKEPFLVAYILDPTPEKREAILYLSEKLGGIKIINLLDGFLWNFEKNKKALNLPNCIENLQVEDWLYYLSKAEYVITDSCHGASFALIFNRNLTAITNKRRGFSRFKSLFELFDIKSHLVTDPKNIIGNTNLLEQIDYSKFNQKMKLERERCYKWLESVLNEEKADNNTLYERNVINKSEKKRLLNSIDAVVVNCTGCSGCSAVCPKNAITMIENGEGFLKPVVEYDKCIDCGLCVKKCIDINPQYVNNSEPECYAMMANDEIRKISSSGGMFTIAANYIIENGGYVCGAAYREDFTVEHIIVNSKEELSKLRGSKYMQSHMGNVYAEIKKLLEDNSLVLFTGMPCQVAGLYSYLGKDYEKLYTIDLLCHGITSSKVFEKYHKEVLNGKELTRLEFKEKEPWGWHAGVNAYFADGTKYSNPLEKDLYFIAYLKSIAKNTTCGVCKVNRLPRQADLTMGDFWGIPKSDAEMYDGKGTSVVLINNQKAAGFFEELKPTMLKFKKERLVDAINGNKIIKAPYRLHKNRDIFFENFDQLDFESLTKGCFYNNLYKYQYQKLLDKVPQKYHDLYYLAKATAENSNGRKIVTWQNSNIFEDILAKFFGKSVEFSVFKDKNKVNGLSIRDISVLNGKSNEYYVVALHQIYSTEFYSLLAGYGYSEIKDFIFRKHKPIILSNFDCSKGRYSDAYGNTIDGWNAVIGRIVFNGCNNHIILGKEVGQTENLKFELSCNSMIDISDKTRFNAETKIQILGYNGNSEIIIKDDCRFTDATIRLYNNPYTSSVLINEKCTFETNLEIHANSGKKIDIGRDCMFSHNIDLWAGDGHTIFDVTTGENINSNYASLPEYRNRLVIGNHVWVSKGAFIMHGTNIGYGSIVGAMSVVKGKYPNNCTIAGNPSLIVRKNIAWSRNMVAMDMHKECGSEEYVKNTLEEQNKKKIETYKIKRWLVTGGSTGLGKQLVLRLHQLGYIVATTSRDIQKLQELPDDIIKISLDVKDIKSCREAVEIAISKMGGIDVLVNNAGVSHTSTFEETPNEIAESIIGTNYWGVANMMKSVISHMRYNKNGTIINISSASGFRARNYGSYYVASKFAVESLTKNIKFEAQRFMRIMSVELGGLNTGLSKRQTVIPTKFDEYKNLPPLYPFKKGYHNRINKAVEAIIEITNNKELPRDLILGWDAYQQFPMAIDDFEKEVEKYKSISITTDEVKEGKILLEDITIPRNKNLKVQNWLITGASGGFGKVLALRLNKLGYNVTVTSRDIEKLNSFPDSVNKIQSNLESFEECRSIIDKAIEIMGSVDVLVNNATSNCWCSFEEIPDDIMREVFDVNYTVPQNMIKAFVPYMRKSKNGTVVNITSIAGIQPRARVSTYSAAKAALEGLTRTLKSECQRFGRFMAVELVCMRTGIMIHNPVIESKFEEYKDLGRYTQKINNIPNRKDIAAQQIINVVNQDQIPQSLLIGTESYLIAKDEVERARKDYEEYKDTTLSVCDK